MVVIQVLLYLIQTKFLSICYFLLFIYLAAPRKVVATRGIFDLCCGMWNLYCSMRALSLVVACGIQFPDQESNPGSPHWDHKCYSLDHQGIPSICHFLNGWISLHIVQVLFINLIFIVYLAKGQEDWTHTLICCLTSFHGIHIKADVSQNPCIFGKPAKTFGPALIIGSNHRSVCSSNEDVIFTPKHIKRYQRIRRNHECQAN